MLNFDSLSLKALISEIEPILTEGRVQKVQQVSKNELLLTVRALRQTHKLYICADPKYPHVAILGEKGTELRNIEIPQKPPMFCMLLRKHMEGAKINAVKQPGHERILEIYFESYSELGEKVTMVLACEFMGKHSNIVLYSYETNIISGCAHPVSHEKSREREISGGLPYIYPPNQKKYDLCNLSFNEFFNLSKVMDSQVNIWLNKNFGFISKALATEFCEFIGISIEKDKITAISKEKMHQLYNLAVNTINFDNINPSISRNKNYYSLIGLEENDYNWERIDSVNIMIDLYFGYQIFNDKFFRMKSFLEKIIKKELKKYREQYSEHLKKSENEDKQGKYRQNADIIMANLYKIKTGADFLEANNFFDENKVVKIPLDKQLSPSENAQRYYKLYNKAKKAAEYSKSITDKISQDIAYYESVLGSLNQSEFLSDLKEIEQELANEGLLKTANDKNLKKDKQEKITLLKFISSDGKEIFAGKNNKQNDFLLKSAEPEDIWLHTQNIPGSHVLIKNDGDVPETTLHDAVYIAAYYSQAKDSSNVPVVYTKRKFVKKPAGAKPGFVIYSNEKTLWVNPETEKINSLKKNI